MTYFLVKFFTKQKYAKEFVQGKVFANRLSAFKKSDDVDVDGRIDKYEGTTALYQPEKISLKIDGHEFSSNDLAGPIRFQMKWLNHVNIVCLHAGHVRDDLELPNLSEEGVEILRKELLVPDECLSLGEYAVVIQNGPEFIKRMDAAINAKNYKFYRKLVKYYSEESFHGEFKGLEAAFMKQDKYKFQREYRYAFWDDSLGEHPITIDIGDISDITMEMASDEINGEKFLGGNLELHEKH